ncbi:MAG: hypothetical protein ABS36_01590 [Acidobacteria bacterium SCN 69-37]|nr:MAG: hypothetical protein ABS36_01590 [Acidobacteria bacterium SCN 69-37]
MAVSYTSARQRDRRRTRAAALRLRPDRLLVGVALVSILLIVTAYVGRMRTFDAGEAARSTSAISLGTVADAAALEPAMSLAFAQPADRRLVARELYAALQAAAGTAPANVGALSALTVRLDALDRLPPGSAFTARRVAAERDGRTVVPLFTSADLAAIKPGLVVRTTDQYRLVVVMCALALGLAFGAVPLVWRARGVAGDRVLLAAAWLLVSLGFVVMLSRPDPLRDTLLVVRYTQGAVLGIVLFAVVSLVDVRRLAHFAFSYLPLAAALLLAVILMIFGRGPGTSDARVNLGPMQPMEPIRLLLACFLAGYFARRWEVLRQVSGATFRRHRLPAWMDLPRPDLVLPVLLAMAVALMLFFVLKDLGPALLLSLVFLALFAVARARVAMALVGLAVLVSGFYVGYALGISSTLSARVAMWWSPWENVARGGDQVAQALWGFASGALSGTGLGLGATRYLPAGHTDLVLAAIGEELGAMGMLTVAVAFVVIAWRGLAIARRASTDYGLFLALAMTLTLVVPVLVMSAGLLGLIPLTGVVTPFLSYGGSAMAVNFLALGLVVACRGGRQASVEPTGEAFHVPMRWLARTMAAAAIGLVIVWGRTQIVSADALLVRPQLGRQADGGVRFQYNPRVLDMARLLPRGTIFDRAGIPLATDDVAVAHTEADAYRRLGIDVDRLCPPAGDARCYPFGGEMFHLLGDARTRANWAASNSSYVERDAEARLRGFDDRAVIVRTGQEGESGVALRRDYAPLVPLVRHRWEPEHPAVRAVFERPRDVRLTIDARLQHQVSVILARAVTSARVTRGAAVVVDADSGEVLASVSYPWPSTAAADGLSSDASLDRARYGLYPPGSTFKVVTAAAALRADPALAGLSFVCERLPDNRAGARIAGYGRPVRDDVRDRHAHGSIAMRDGFVQSCNAYFAQLAVRIGADRLAETSALAGIALSSSSDAGALRDTLPYAGFGQGQVVASPLRLARVVAAVASDGLIREAPIVRESGQTVATSFLPPGEAHVIAGFMRGAVTDGTGRLLASHPSRIAGKTGTAELEGAPSHAWFVGFAPYGEATRRIAFAVLLEHGGYGGASAAAASGQIVTAAAALGLVR